MNALQAFLNWNRALSDSLERAVNGKTGRRSGMSDFGATVLPSLLKPEQRILDVGSGKQPLICREQRQRFNLHVTGLDISADELRQAPEGAYDETIVMDAANGSIPGEYDLILSHTVLEHLRDTPAAILGMADALAPGGTMAHFLPCRNALFARLNLLVGTSIAQRLLKLAWPGQSAVNGFPAYYDACTPRQLGRLCQSNGLDVVETQPYFASAYVKFLFPLHVVDVARQVTCMWLGLTSMCETFTIVAHKPASTTCAESPRFAA